jgi:hypothetical protein
MSVSYPSAATARATSDRSDLLQPFEGGGVRGRRLQSEVRRLARLGVVSVALCGAVVAGQLAVALAASGAAAPGQVPVAFWLVAAQVGAALTTITWLGRSRTLADDVAPRWRHARAPHWSWLGWFVPVVAFWFPYQVVRDVARATGSAARHPVAPSGFVLASWWASWLVSGALSAAVALLGASQAAQEWSGFAAVLVAALCWALVVRGVTRAQRAGCDVG